MIVLLMAFGCRFYDGPRNQPRTCEQPGVLALQGVDTTFLSASDFHDVELPSGGCGDDKPLEAVGTWTPSFTGQAEITVTGNQELGISVLTPCPDLSPWECATGWPTAIVEVPVVAGEPMVILVRAEVPEDVELTARQLGGSIDTDPPEDTGNARLQCGTEAPWISDVQAYAYTLQTGELALNLDPTMQDGDGALHAYEGLIYFDDDIDGTLDLGGPLLGTGVVPGFGRECSSYGPYTASWSLLVGGDLAYATHYEFGVVVVDADGHPSPMYALSAVTPADDPPDDTDVTIGCVPDAYEPNDDLGNASTPGGNAYGLTICPADDDFFHVHVDPGEQVEVTLAFTHALGDIDAQLFDLAGNGLGSQTSTTDNEVFLLTNAGPGPTIYVIRVFGYQAAVENTYDLLEVRTPPAGCAPDGLEPNDTDAEATLITNDGAEGLTICAGDHDHFRFSVPAGWQISVNVSFVNASGNLDIQLLDPFGQVIDTQANDTDSEVVLGFNDTGATLDYLVHVYGRDGGVENTYDISPLFTPPP